MKSISKIRMMVAAGLALAATSCSDYSDYNTVPEDSLPSSNQTLWQNIESNENLKDFAAIINKGGYASVLNTPNYYTVWAPLDGTYDAQAVLAKDSDDIVNEFITNHMAEFSYLNSGEANQRVLSLNEKKHQFTGAYYDDMKVKQTNIPASNGIMHTLNGASPFYTNLYQEIDELEGCDKFKEYIQSYDEYYLDLKASVEGPMVDGKQTYLDSVFKKRNLVIDRFLHAQLENEDSTYTMIYPTDQAWQTAYDTIVKRMNYLDKPLYYMDMGQGNVTPAASIKAETMKSQKPIEIDHELYTDSLTKALMITNFVFSNNDTRNNAIWTGQLSSSQPDTLRTTTGITLTNVEDIFKHTVGDVKKHSNGYSRVLDSLCFHSWETYEPIIGSVSPIRALGLAANKNVASHSIPKTDLIGRDSLFEDVPAFLKKIILPENSRHFTYRSIDREDFNNNMAKPEMDFALRNVLSTKYYIYVVTVPSQMLNPEEDNQKPLYLRFDLSFTDAAGTQKFVRLNVKDAKLSADIIVKPGKVNVIKLEYEFPICYAGLDAYPTLFISNTKAFATSANRNKFEQELRINGVYLVPASAHEYYQNITE